MNLALRNTLLALAAGALLSGRAATPPAEQLLPPDTLALLTIPDVSKSVLNDKSTPAVMLWNDAAMRPFRDKLMAKLQTEVFDKLEKEAGIKLSEYADLLQGQFSLAITRNGWSGTADPLPALVLILDARDKGDQLKTKLADLRKRLTDSGQTLKTEKIRDVEFTQLTLDPGKATAADAPKVSLLFGQVGSVLVAGTATRDLDRVAGLLGGASMPKLSEEAAFDADSKALFRDAAAFGWINVTPLVEVLNKVLSSAAEGQNPGPKPDAILTALGIKGLKTLAAATYESAEGAGAKFNIANPWQERKGLLKLIATEAKDSGIPAFVPVDTSSFWRWRLDLQKFWATIEATVNEVAPGMLGFLTAQIDAGLKEKDPNLDFKRSFIMNLGDDLIGYQKPPKSSSPEDLLSQPAISLIGSANAEQLLATLRSAVALLPGPLASMQFKDREFLGRKIYTVTLPDMANTGKEPQLHMAASGGYVAFSSDAAILEEYLRSSETKPKPLADLPGLKAAAEKVGGMGTGLFGFQNDAEALKPFWEGLRTNKGLFFDLIEAQNPALKGAMGNREEIEKTVAEWADFSLLPTWDKVSKYFFITVSAGKMSNAGYLLSTFSPMPPQLKQ